MEPKEQVKKEIFPPYFTPRTVWKNPWYFIAFGFGSGASPIAPGTFGTLMAIPFYLFLQPLPPLFYLIALLCFIAAGIVLTDRVSKAIKVHDHPGITIDEFAGFFVTMFNAPPGILWIGIGFILFRFFDVLKPWPIRLIDKRLGGGAGIMLDDVLAGVYSFVVLQIIANLLGK